MANVISIPSKVITPVTQIYGIETSMPVANNGLKKPSDIKQYITKVNESKLYEALQNSASSNSKLQGLFNGCSALTALNLSGWTNLSSQKSMQQMFYNCNKLVSLNLTGLDTSTITNMFQMFRYCSSLISLDLSGFNTANVTNMQYIFGGCTSLTKMWVPSTFVATKVTTGSYKPFYNTSGHTGGTHVYTDATDATTQNWGTIHNDFIMHYNSTYSDYENA